MQVSSDFTFENHPTLLHWKGCAYYTYTLMAVPKKKTSKSKRDKRRATWVNKAAIQAKKALSLGKSVLTGRSTSFVYPQPDVDEAGE